MRIVAGKYSNIDLLDLDSLAKHHFNVAIKHFKAMAKCGMLKKPVAEYFVRVFYGDYMSYEKMYTIKSYV